MTQPTLEYRPSPPPTRYWTGVFLFSAATAIASAGISYSFLLFFVKPAPLSAPDIETLMIAAPTTLGATLFYMVALALQRRFRDRLPHPNLFRPLIAGLACGILAPALILLFSAFQGSWSGLLFWPLLALSLAAASFPLTKDDTKK